MVVAEFLLASFCSSCFWRRFIDVDFLSGAVVALNKVAERRRLLLLLLLGMMRLRMMQTQVRMMIAARACLRPAGHFVVAVQRGALAGCCGRTATTVAAVGSMFVVVCVQQPMRVILRVVLAPVGWINVWLPLPLLLVVVYHIELLVGGVRLQADIDQR